MPLADARPQWRVGVHSPRGGGEGRGRRRKGSCGRESRGGLPRREPDGVLPGTKGERPLLPGPAEFCPSGKCPRAPPPPALSSTALPASSPVPAWEQPCRLDHLPFAFLRSLGGGKSLCPEPGRREEVRGLLPMGRRLTDCPHGSGHPPLPSPTLPPPGEPAGAVRAGPGGRGGSAARRRCSSVGPSAPPGTGCGCRRWFSARLLRGDCHCWREGQGCERSGRLPPPPSPPFFFPSKKRPNQPNNPQKPRGRGGIPCCRRHPPLDLL